MAVAVVDTSVLVGMANTDDPHHDTALEIVSSMDQGTLPTGRVTNYVVLETLNWIHAREHHEKATEMYRRLHESAGFEVVQTAQKDFSRAVELFETYDSIAFGDATIAAYMERTDIEYLYSFDEDFDGLGVVTRLDTPVNPFA